MAEIAKNALTSLVNSLNETITFAREASPNYQTTLNNTITVLENCYLIPTELRSVTKYQTDTLRHILETFFSIKQTTGFNKELDDTENKIYDIFREFDRYKNTYMTVSSSILEKLSSIQEIHEIIEKMKDIAREIQLFSINSVIVASQAGSSGIAFKSISRFIIELSDSIQKSATQLTIYRDKIMSVHKRVEKLFQKLIQGIYEESTAKLKKNILGTVKKTRDQFQFISVILANTDQRILQTIQDGQIVERQYKPGTRNLPILEYWNNALALLGEIPEKHVSEDSPSDILSAVAYASHILNALGKRMSNHSPLLNGFLARIDGLYSSLVGNFGLAQQDSMYIFNYMSEELGKGIPSFFERLFSQFTGGLKELKTLLSQEASVKNELLEVFVEINKIYTEGLSFFANFEKFFVIMNNINVLAQIELSKQDFNGGNAGLKVKFTNMLDQLKFFNEDIKNRIQKMLQSLIVQINNFNDTNIEQANFLVETNFFLDTQDSRLDFSKTNSEEVVDTIREENAKIFAVETQSRNYLKGFQDNGKSYIRDTAEIYDNIILYQGRFNGIVSYYDINLREYAMNNPFIQNYEKNLARFLRGTS